MTPTVGRIVHYFPGPNDVPAHTNGLGADDPIAAVVVRVWSEHTVNLCVLADGPYFHWRTSVQHADVAPGDSPQWDWPPRV